MSNFATMSEAYEHNGLKKQLNDLEKHHEMLSERLAMENNINNEHKKFGLDPPHIGDMSSFGTGGMTMDTTPDFYQQTFIDTEGKFVKGKNLKGTSLRSLQMQEEMENNDSLSLSSDSSIEIPNFDAFSSESSSYATVEKNHKKKSPKLKSFPQKNLNYRKLAQEMVKEMKIKDTSTEDSSVESTDTFARLKNLMKKKKSPKTKVIHHYEKSKDKDTWLTSETRDIIIVIIIGVAIVFFIDIFIRLFKILDKNK